MPKKKIYRGGRFKRIKKEVTIHSITSSTINVPLSLINKKKEEIDSVPLRPFKIFPRRYYNCTLSEDGDLVCWE